MLNELETWLAPYLQVFGNNEWMQAGVAIFGSLIIAWIFDHVLCAGIKKMTARTPFRFDDILIEYLHRPIYLTLILIGLALATQLLKFSGSVEQITFSVLLTLGYIVWTIFLLRATRGLLQYLAR